MDINGMNPGTFGGRGWAYNRMYVLFTGRRAYIGGGGRGGAMADPDLQVRGGDGHSVPEKKGMEPFQEKNFRPQFGLKQEPIKWSLHLH